MNSAYNEAYNELKLLASEQKAEIKRLRTERDEQYGSIKRLLDDLDAAQTEIERLKAVLQKIADDGKNCQDYCRNQARRALEPQAMMRASPLRT